MGWCAVEPRPEYVGLVRNSRVPWAGRSEDKSDRGVWALTCLFTRAGFRRGGVSCALALAAVDFARERGARAIEGYPTTTKKVIEEELPSARAAPSPLPASPKSAGRRCAGR